MCTLLIAMENWKSKFISRNLTFDPFILFVRKSRINLFDNVSRRQKGFQQRVTEHVLTKVQYPNVSVHNVYNMQHLVVNKLYENKQGKLTITELAKMGIQVTYRLCVGRPYRVFPG